MNVPHDSEKARYRHGFTLSPAMSDTTANETTYRKAINQVRLKMLR